MNLFIKISLTACIACSCLPSWSQSFTSGSDGSYGAINITTDTILPTPGDGVFHATTVFVASNSVLRFMRNNLNTPIHLLATGTVEIEGKIDVSGGDYNGALPGLGGPGGFDGGVGGGSGQIASAGLGPGGGQPGGYRPQSGVFSENASTTGGSANTNVYGNALLMPIVGGSGGGGIGTKGGGGGGGAILIASTTLIKLDGEILSLGGGPSGTGAGSGGAVRLVTPTILGIGKIDVDQGNDLGLSNLNSKGRIRIDTQSPVPNSLTIEGSASVGTYMQVLPLLLPKLEIIEVAGQPVAPNAATMLTIPIGASLVTSIQVKATGFQGLVPVQIALTPDVGPRTLVNYSINMAGNPSVTETISITLSDNTLHHLHVWTKP